MRQVLTIEEGQFLDYNWDWEEKDLCAALGNVDWSRIQFVCVEREPPPLPTEPFRHCTGAGAIRGIPPQVRGRQHAYHFLS